MDQLQTWINGIPEETLRTVGLVLFLALLFLACAAIGRWFGRSFMRRKTRHSENVVSITTGRRKSATDRGSFLAKVFALLLLVAVGGGVFFLIQYASSQEGLQLTLSGSVTHVRDGDTIEVDGIAIRLNGLTCDERGTVLGDRATRAMQGLVSGETVTCRLNGDKTFDREVGRCTLSDGRDLGAELISDGVCGRCSRNDPRRTYAAVQREAEPYPGTNPSYCWSFW